jgi:hypothetical protein
MVQPSPSNVAITRPSFTFKAPDDVATAWITALNHRLGIGQRAFVARILEVIENEFQLLLSGQHGAILPF